MFDFLSYQQHCSVFIVLICTVRSTMKTLSTVGIACEMVITDGGYWQQLKRVGDTLR